MESAKVAGHVRTPSHPGMPGGERHLGQGLARAAGGSLIFSLPMFLTMELWHLGFYLDRLRLAVLLAIMAPVLIGVAHFRGFQPTFGWRDDVISVSVAFTVAFSTAVVLLPFYSVIHSGMSANEIIGKVTIQAIPASLGALLARGQFFGEGRAPVSYGETMFWGGVGALYMALNLAPTQEMALLSQKISWAQAILLLVLSLVILQGFTCAAERLKHDAAPLWTRLFSYSIPAYGLSLVVSFYMLWSFSRTDDLSWAQVVREVIVLGLPVSVGTAASRFIL